jgi:type I restriction enzyme, S subunit
MKAYSSYRPSDYEWIGEIPKHWGIRKLKYLTKVNFSNVDKHTVDNETTIKLCNYVDVYNNDFIDSNINFMKATATEKEIRKFQLLKDDVLVTKDSETWEDIAVPAYVTENIKRVICGYHLAQIRPQSISGNYLFWALSSKTINDQYKVEAHGITRYGLGKDALENSYIAYPPKEEQENISYYLNYASGHIDELISKKQRQIDLLEEYRTALINQAVTKGLDPNAPMKESGFEWLGDIPSHWEISKLRWVTNSVQTGKTPPSNKTEYFEPKEINWFTPSDLDDNLRLFSSSRKLSKQAIKDNKAPLFDIGTILIIGIGATLGKIAILESSGSSNQQINAISYNNRIYSEYGLYYLNAIKPALINFANFTTLPILNQSETKEIPHLVPPLHEQEKIIKELRKDLNSINLLIQKISKSILYLKDFRDVLISQVVTGKIDVRNWKWVEDGISAACS